MTVSIPKLLTPLFVAGLFACPAYAQEATEQNTPVEDSIDTADSVTSLPDVNFVDPVGDRIFAGDDDRRLWLLDESGGQQKWVRLKEPEGVEPKSLSWAGCNNIGKPLCIMLFGDGPKKRLARYIVGTNDIVLTDVEASDGIGHNGRDTVYLENKDEAGARRLFAYNFETGETRQLGPIAEDEQFTNIIIDGKPELVAFSFFRPARLADSDDGQTFFYAFTDGNIAMDFGVVSSENWGSKEPFDPNFRFIYAATYDRDGNGNIAPDGYGIAAFRLDENLPESNSLAVNSEGDIMGVFTGANSRNIGLICNLGEGEEEYRTSYTIKDLSVFESAYIRATKSSRIFIVKLSHPSYSDRYLRITLNKVAGPAFENRTCGNISIDTSSIALTESLQTEGWETVETRITGTDGHDIDYVMLRQRDVEPDHVLIDIYGSYAIPVHFATYQEELMDKLAENNTAYVSAIVRGDGNKGYAYGAASKTPNRMRAVEDVAAVSADILAKFPDLKSKPTVSGGSAGGWLATRSVLHRPDLFAGAIGYAGQYIIKENDFVLGGNATYFALEDSLLPVVQNYEDGCKGLKFRFLHARDDLRVTYSGAKEFAELLTAKKCDAELVTFDEGGHSIAIRYGQDEEEERHNNAMFTPF